MCVVGSSPAITVGLTIEEARRIGDLNIDINEVEIIRWRRKVRDAVREHEAVSAIKPEDIDARYRSGMNLPPDRP